LGKDAGGTEKYQEKAEPHISKIVEIYQIRKETGMGGRKRGSGFSFAESNSKKIKKNHPKMHAK